MAVFKLCHISGRWHLWAAFFLSDLPRAYVAWVSWATAYVVTKHTLVLGVEGGSKLRVNKTRRVD
jgi:hypothetical protein